MTKPKKIAEIAPPKPIALTDDMIAGAIRESLEELVRLMNVGRAHGVKTLFSIRPYEVQNPNNPEAPYTLMTLELVRRYHNGQS